ncbi:MAG: hypothetical protein U0795_10630 [Pirellulales bacterium]
MKHSLLLCALLLMQPRLMAVEISVADRQLLIPSPAGYSLITSDLPYAELASHFVPPSFEQFALFLPEEDVIAAARGEIRQPQRWFCVKSPREQISIFFSATAFAELKEMVKKPSAEVLEKVEFNV